MLPKQENKIDIDGYVTLLLSTLLMFATAGLSYVFFFRKILNTAKNETHLCSDNVLLFVLGKRLIKNKPDTEYVQRLKRVHTILNTNKDSQVIVLGGKTGDASITEAHAGKVFLENNDIESSRIELEQSSRNTLENLKNAIDLLKEKNKKIVIVSNRYHLARAKNMAEGFGLNVDLCAAEEKFKINLLSLSKIMIEAVHVHWYFSGRYYAHLTHNKRMINRIG